jgi:site-specific recombinase XerD
VVARGAAAAPASETNGEAPDLLGALSAAGPGAGGLSTGGPSASRRARRHKLQAALLELARGQQDLDGARQPFELAASFLRRFEGRARTQVAYADDLADWFAWLEHAGAHPFEVTLATVESYSREPLVGGRPASPATVSRRLACLSHFYRRAVYAGLVRRNPLEHVQRPKVPEPVATLGLSKSRAQALLGAARSAGPRDTLLVLLMLELGLRVSEACSADIEDLSEQGRHRVLAIRGKGQKTKASLVPLNGALIEAVARAVGERRRGPLLATANGHRVTRQHANKIIHHMGCQIGIPELHPHALRHAFVTLSLDEGGTLRDVQDAARHADPRTTRRYDTNRRSLDRHPTHMLAEALEPWREAECAADAAAVG